MTDHIDLQTRKLQKVGGSTYTVSVPKRWARDQALEAGAEIHLYTYDDGSLVVRSSERDGGDLTTARVELETTTESAVERALKAAYAVGFEDITLVAPDEFGDDECRAVRRLARTLVGTEVVEEGDDHLTVRNLLESNSVSVEQSLIQLQFVALSMHRTATAAVTGAETAGEVPARDDEADRLFGLLRRHFTRSLTAFEELDRLGVGRTDLFAYYRTACQLERVADHAVTLARTADRLADPLDGEVGDELGSVAEQSRQVVEAATDAVLEGASTETVHDLFDQYEQAVEDADALDRRLLDRESAEADRTPDQAYLAARVTDRLAGTADCGGTIAEVAAQSVVRAQN